MSINPNSVWDIVAARTVSPTPSPVKGYQGKTWGPIKGLAANVNRPEPLPPHSTPTYKPVVGGRKTRKNKNKRRHTKKRRSHRKN